MAAAVLLRSLARKMARAAPAHHHPLPARELHGGARSGPGASSVAQPPTRYEQRRVDVSQFRVGMAAAAGLRSLATKLARAPPPPHHRLVHERGLHSLNSPNSGASGSTSTPPTSKIDLVTALAKIRASVAYVTLFGSLVYMYGSLLPRLERLKAKLEAQKQSELDDALALDEALGILLAEYRSKNGSDTAQIMQSSGHGKQPAGETGKGTKLKDLEAEITKLQLTLEAAKLELALEVALKEMDSLIKK